MQAIKTHKNSFMCVLTACLVMLMIIGVSGCAPKYSKLMEFANRFDVGLSGEVLASESTPSSLFGALETHEFVVDGGEAAEDLRNRLQAAGFTPIGDPNESPDAYWSFTDSDNVTFLAQVKDLNPHDPTGVRGSDGRTIIADGKMALITFSG